MPVTICARDGCGSPTAQRATGRPARFCSGACRQGAYRDRARARAAADAAPPPHRSGQPVAWNAARQDLAGQLRATRQDRLRRAAAELARMLDHMTGQDEPATRELLRDLAASLDLRRDTWPE